MLREKTLYPFRLEPMFQYRIWGGRNLESLLGVPLPGPGPYGEAWVLSDRPDHSSVVVNGELAGRTLTDLMADFGDELLGKFSGKFTRFPLLLKFLDAQQVLSVQVHPSDDQTDLLPPGELGKTEAWVILQTHEKSIVYAGLKSNESREDIAEALKTGSVQDKLASFTPQVKDTVFIPAGTVHTMGGLVAFEVQENSDMTFRLFDWGHVDPKTGKPRDLHIEQGLESIQFPQGPVKPVTPVEESAAPVRRERLVECGHFNLWRLSGVDPFSVGEEAAPRIVVCLSGKGQLTSSGIPSSVSQGEVWLLPAAIGECQFEPISTVEVLEIAIPAV